MLPNANLKFTYIITRFGEGHLGFFNSIAWFLSVGFVDGNSNMMSQCQRVATPGTSLDLVAL